jgi:hypothetical protein
LVGAAVSTEEANGRKKLFDLSNVEIMEPPALRGFTETVRGAFAFLRQFGFEEVSPPTHRAQNPFQIWFKADQRFVVVTGEGWGTMAAVMLEHENGLQLAEIDLVPHEDRPGHGSDRQGQTGQLQQIREAAQRLEKHGSDFLAGDVTRFLARAKRLPPYKRSPV